MLVWLIVTETALRTEVSAMSQQEGNPAQTYEDFYVANLFRPWTGELISRAEPRPGERILDLACGTGIVARLVFRHLEGRASISGLDLNPAMIDVARAAADREGAAIDWHVGSADSVPFPVDTFDLVTIQQGLQFFPDRPAALREIHRVLKPGGRIATETWTEIERNHFNQAMARAVERQLGRPAMDVPFSLGSEVELRELFTGAEFAEIYVERVTREVRFPEPDRYLEHRIASLSAAVAEFRSIDADRRSALVDGIRAEMAGTLRSYTVGSELVYGTEAHIATAHKPARSGTSGE